MSDLDEMIHIAIHESELPHLPKRVRQFIEEYSSIQVYQGGLKKGKKFDKIKEFKRVIKAMLRERKKNKGQESNYECHLAGNLAELFERMMLHEIRRLKLEKLV